MTLRWHQHIALFIAIAAWTAAIGITLMQIVEAWQ